MKKKNAEVTGKKVASIAGKVLQALKPWRDGVVWMVTDELKVTAGELRALAASALTQAEDKQPAGVTHARIKKALSGKNLTLKPIQEFIKFTKKHSATKPKRKPVITKIAHYSDKDYGWNVPTSASPRGRLGRSEEKEN